MHGIEQEDATHKLEVVVHGIDDHQDLNPVSHFADVIGRPKNRRQIHPGRDNNGPQVHNVAEKDRQRRQHHAQAHAEAHKQQQANRQQN